MTRANECFRILKDVGLDENGNKLVVVPVENSNAEADVEADDKKKKKDKKEKKEKKDKKEKKEKKEKDDD